MKLSDIFEYFGLSGSHNLSALPDFARKLIEIHRIECLRRNNHENNLDQIKALGEHPRWASKRIVLAGGFDLSFLNRTIETASIVEIDKIYDHVICFSSQLYSCLPQQDTHTIESYLHKYTSSDKEIKVVAPNGVKVHINQQQREFSEAFIKNYLSRFWLCELEAN